MADRNEPLVDRSAPQRHADVQAEAGILLVRDEVIPVGQRAARRVRVVGVVGDETRRVDNEECANVGRSPVRCCKRAWASCPVVLTQGGALFERALDIQKNQIGCAERIAGLFREQPRHLVRVFVCEGDRLMPATPDDPGNQYFNQQDAQYGKDANASDLQREGNIDGTRMHAVTVRTKQKD